MGSPADDAIAWSPPPDCPDRVGSADAREQTLPPLPLGRAGDQERAIAHLDGRVAQHAAEGEMIMGQAVRREPPNGPVTTVMRSLLLPRARPQ